MGYSISKVISGQYQLPVGRNSSFLAAIVDRCEAEPTASVSTLKGNPFKVRAPFLLGSKLRCGELSFGRHAGFADQSCLVAAYILN